jgi:uncharacterized protein (DUF4415 family)
MQAGKKLINADGEVGELTATDLVQFQPAAKVLPTSLQAKLGMGVRGPQKAPTKERITIRLSPEVVGAFRASGDGWQVRMDDALKEWLRDHQPA